MKFVISRIIIILRTKLILATKQLNRLKLMQNLPKQKEVNNKVDQGHQVLMPSLINYLTNKSQIPKLVWRT